MNKEFLEAAFMYKFRLQETIELLTNQKNQSNVEELKKCTDIDIHQRKNQLAMIEDLIYLYFKPYEPK